MAAPAFVFDLDGTLVDSVYQHVLAWREAARLGVDIAAAVVVGDSVWDLLAARRARALGVGLLSGGYGQEELERAGAYRVYQDPADLLQHLDEVGVRTS
jgi:phosphoglycolate phosphatase-like HAD superfamily hydrolase